jgi:hypothetical protein
MRRRKQASQRALEFSLFTSAILLLAHPLLAYQVAVRHLEGRIHGFLVLRDLDDNIRLWRL